MNGLLELFVGDSWMKGFLGLLIASTILLTCGFLCCSSQPAASNAADVVASEMAMAALAVKPDQVKPNPLPAPDNGDVGAIGGPLDRFHNLEDKANVTLDRLNRFFDLAMENGVLIKIPKESVKAFDVPVTAAVIAPDQTKPDQAKPDQVKPDQSQCDGNTCTNGECGTVSKRLPMPGRGLLVPKFMRRR